MIKLTYFIHRLPALSPEEFHDHWRHHHAELIKKHAPTFDIRRYIQLHATGDPRNEPTPAFPRRYDGVAELWFGFGQGLEEWFRNTTPEAIIAGKEIRDDERTFIDRANSPFLIGEEASIIPD